MAVYYEWYCTEHFANGKRRRSKLRWKMTQEQALEWGTHPDNHGKVLELVAGRGEERTETAAPYVGWGQALPDESIAAAKQMGDRWRPKR